MPIAKPDAGVNMDDRMTINTIIAVDHVIFGYRKRMTVLDDIFFEVPQGQTMVLLGYNGVGKTTLFNLIVGLLRPRSGRCVINRALVPSMRDVFLMTEHADLIGSMTVRDNIRFRAMLFNDVGGDADNETRGVDSTALDGEPLVQAFELGPYLDTKVSELSSGLRKRAGLVAGMLFDPHVIMLDEPTNSIDPITRDLFIEYVNQLHADGRTVLTITHDLEYCWKTAERVVVLDDRHIARDIMLTEVPDYETFTGAATLGRSHMDVDFGLRRTTYMTTAQRG